MAGKIMGLIMGIFGAIRVIIVKTKYKKIKGIATGNSTLRFEEYEYEYLGRKYTAYGFTYGPRKAGKTYTIWVNEDNPEKIATNSDHIMDCFFAINIPICIYIILTDYIM